MDRELTSAAAPNSFEPQVVPGSKESTATSMRPDRVDVAVVGAGQAGLAIGHFLARQGRRFVIFEAADAVGTAWRNRWDSLVLFTPRRYDALPGLRFPGDPDGYPTRDEVIAYLEQYRAAFDLPIEFNSAVRSLTTADDTFRIELDDRQVVADQVVVATGPFHEPRIPEVAAQLAPEVFQLHSSGYRRPGDVPEGARPGRRRWQQRLPDRQGAVGESRRRARGWFSPDATATEGARPRSFLVADEARSADEDSRLPDRKAGPRPRHAHRLKPPGAETASWRNAEATRSPCLGADRDVRRRQPRQEFNAVIWATGYRPDHSWIHIPCFSPMAAFATAVA